MADRIFKGKIVITTDIDHENQTNFPEASSGFNKKHAGGLNPVHTLFNVLKSAEDSMADPENIRSVVRAIDGSIMINGLAEIGKDLWVKIDPDGTIEIGTSGV
jgi:hypothetical protein